MTAAKKKRARRRPSKAATSPVATVVDRLRHACTDARALLTKPTTQLVVGARARGLANALASAQRPVAAMVRLDAATEEVIAWLLAIYDAPTEPPAAGDYLTVAQRREYIAGLRQSERLRTAQGDGFRDPPLGFRELDERDSKLLRFDDDDDNDDNDDDV